MQMPLSTIEAAQQLPRRDLSTPDVIVEHAMALTTDFIEKGASRRRLVEMRRDLPYVIMRVGDSVQILLNRHYKPCSDPPRPDYWARYEDWPHHHVRLTQEEIGEVVLNRDAGRVLFDDGCAPWLGVRYARQYLARLSTLSRALARG
jgi:hypothetical protein